MPNQNYVLFSGGAQGAENQFGKLAEYHGLSEVNFTFEGHRIERTRGVRVLTDEELTQKDVSLTYVSRLLNRKFTNAEKMRKVLQTIMWQVDASQQIFVVGTILDDGTVKGGTGWGAEFAKICNKELFVFDQAKDAWSTWEHGAWVAVDAPKITAGHFTGTGTRFLEENGKKALEDLFSRSFK
ncbi:hypothetical protein DND132_3292 [Pseudodesulfovibrio mercurii]|uniref:Uncharacterized protein n=1 Tax=Pseudodesulfovibrio mercurii TaxID=641491 RepID=F0JKP6_9BACT|nr:hypothetical protein [Pseudodesulfovibrio mercurii]EGB16495.1 hypothetical protein DND132_3292 [Pseudodesulfovibrio mercurii]